VCTGVGLEDRLGLRRRYLVVAETVGDRFGLALSGDGTDDALRSHDLVDAHRDSLLRNVRETLEPAFVDLLFLTVLVQFDHDERFFRLGNPPVDR